MKTTNLNLTMKLAARSIVTDKDIAALEYEAGVFGDDAERKICQRALNGSARSRAYCVRRIRATRVEFAASKD